MSDVIEDFTTRDGCFEAFLAQNKRAEALEEQLSALEAALKEKEQKIDQLKDAPAAELPRLIVCAVIVRDGKILLEKRAPAGIAGRDDSWDLPGGKVEAGETVHSAVEREIYEEMSTRVKCLQLLPEPLHSVWTYPDGEKHHWLLVGCICEIVEGEPKTGDRLEWFGGAELPENLLSADRRLIENYMAVRQERTRAERAEAALREMGKPVSHDEVIAFQAKSGHSLQAMTYAAIATGVIAARAQAKQEHP